MDIFFAPPPPPPPVFSVPLVVATLTVVILLGVAWRSRSTPWDQWGTWLDIRPLLAKWPAGGLPPIAEPVGKSFLETLDIGVRRIHDAEGGLGIPNASLAWNWGMVPVYGLLFSMTFYLTTPLPADAPFPWFTLVKKLFIWFNAWEALGLGVEHGPLHQKFNPPFQDWWYRLTPGTIKYAGPAGHWSFLSMKRSYLDALVEGVLTHVFSLRCLLAPEVTPELVLPLACCGIYEFLFDYGQHMHTYATQNLHLIVCMCFKEGEGQLVGMQLFLTLLYIGSGFCKLGPTFPHMFSLNLASAKFMVNVPWANWYRKMVVKGHDKEPPNYTKTAFAWWFSNGAALIELTNPLLVFTNNAYLVGFSIFTFHCMHVFIIATLIIDVFCWNFTDAIGYHVLYGVLSTGINWEELPNMHPLLATWLICHTMYAIWGHYVPDHMPYVVAHRHAAGNWSQGVLVIRKSAVHKLSRLKLHAGTRPAIAPSTDWASDWYTFYAFASYVWSWNFPSKLLPALVLEAMGDGAPKDGRLHASGDYVLFHSALFYDAVVAHLRFDGLSALRLTEEVGRVCGFEPGECRLCWAGAFPSFVVPPAYTPSANWKILDSVAGVVKQGTYDAATLNDPRYHKPSDQITLGLDLLGGGRASERVPMHLLAGVWDANAGEDAAGNGHKTNGKANGKSPRPSKSPSRKKA